MASDTVAGSPGASGHGAPLYCSRLFVRPAGPYDRPVRAIAFILARPSDGNRGDFRSYGGGRPHHPARPSATAGTPAQPLSRCSSLVRLRAVHRCRRGRAGWPCLYCRAAHHRRTDDGFCFCRLRRLPADCRGADRTLRAGTKLPNAIGNGVCAFSCWRSVPGSTGCITSSGMWRPADCWMEPNFSGPFDQFQLFAFYVPYLVGLEIWIPFEARAGSTSGGLSGPNR